MIEAINLSKSYSGNKVLDTVYLNCEKGEICGLLGANGAGKTTLFKILLGLLKADSGSYKIHSKSKKPIGGIIEKPALYEFLNAYENLRLFAKIQGAAVDKLSLQNYLEKVGLPLDRKDAVRNFSMGMKQRLGIAIALLNNPECLILDEPFSGLDPLGIASLRTLIAKLAAEDGLAILISSHIIEELSRVSQKLFVIEKGKILRSGPTQAIIQANTSEYLICALNIEKSITLKKLNAEISGNCAKVAFATAKIPGLLQELHQEDILITSCTPVIDMKNLFQATAE
tara:strand:- start:528 stop:1382 length:855 start_codon:yes stop_codon:yes gene_type:complete